MFLDKDMMSAHQITTDLETLTFDTKFKVMPQVEDLTKNIYYLLDELNGLFSSILLNDRDPMVSALNFISREPTKQSMSYPSESNKVPAVPPVTLASAAADSTPATSAVPLQPLHKPVEVAPEAAPAHTAGREAPPASASSDKLHIRELQDQYNDIKRQLEDDNKTHEDQLQRNTVVMMEMQDTINELQRELSALGKTAKRNKSSLSSRGMQPKTPSPETSVMFTRLDSERNAKILKKAVMEEKLNAEKYKEAVSTMDQYVSLPAQRLAHLVRKYVHHSRMREVEEKVKAPSSLNDEVFGVLDKMEALQNQRASAWADQMDHLGMERLKLANLLMSTLDGIEQESGLFLVKPMYSYRGREAVMAGNKARGAAQKPRASA